MLRESSWKSWALFIVLLVTFFILGFTWNPRANVADWIYKVGTVGATFIPLVLIGVYTATGSKWWLNDVGTGVVQLALAIVVFAAPLAWAIWEDNGIISGGLAAWVEVCGPLLVTLTVLQLCWLFSRIHRDHAGGGAD